MSQHDKDPLIPVFLLVGMFENIQEVTSRYMEDNFLETNAAISLKPLVLRFIPREVLHMVVRLACVPFRHTNLLACYRVPSKPPSSVHEQHPGEQHAVL